MLKESKQYPQQNNYLQIISKSPKFNFTIHMMNPNFQSKHNDSNQLLNSIHNALNIKRNKTLKSKYLHVEETPQIKTSQNLEN